MKRKAMLATALLAATVLALPACASSNQNPSAQENVNLSKTSYSNEVNPSKYSNTIDATLEADYLYGSDTETLRDKSDEVLEGSVKSLSYVTSGSLAYTIADIEVISSLSDASTFKSGDHVSVLYGCGYIPLKDAIEANEGLIELCKDWSKEKIEKTVVHQQISSEEDPVVGDHAVFFLNKETQFPEFGEDLYSLLNPDGAELKSEDNGNTFEYEGFTKDGKTEPAGSYSAEAIEKAMDSDLTLRKAQQAVDKENK